MSVTARMDKVVDDFVKRGRWWNEPLNAGRARMFALQHRLKPTDRPNTVSPRFTGF